MLALRHLGRPGEAQSRLSDFRDHDRLDWWLADLGGARVATSAATLVDIALEYASCGLNADAGRLLSEAENLELTAPVVGAGNHLPLIVLHRADLLAAQGLTAQAQDLITSADRLDRSRCFPGRLADALMLERLRTLMPRSQVLAALHGHWLYSRGRAVEAIDAWTIADDDPVSLRNRGVAAFNHLKDTAESVRCYERALSVAPADPRLWYERDQLAKQVGEPLADRLARLEAHRDMVDARDDLSVEYVALLLGVGRSREALGVLEERCFQPWEGGEGQVLAVWERVNGSLAREALANGDATSGVALARAAFQPPLSLGEDRHLLANVAHLDLLLGDALRAAGDTASAEEFWRKAASAEGDFVAMSTTPHSERSAFSIFALQQLGRTGEAAELAAEVSEWAEAERRTKAQIDYFATSLPTLLLFHEDPQVRQQLTCDVMRAQARLALGDLDGAGQLLDEVLSVDPSEPFALEARALVLNQAKNQPVRHSHLPKEK